MDDSTRALQQLALIESFQGISADNLWNFS